MVYQTTNFDKTIKFKSYKKVKVQYPYKTLHNYNSISYLPIKINISGVI